MADRAARIAESSKRLVDAVKTRASGSVLQGVKIPSYATVLDLMVDTGITSFHEGIANFLMLGHARVLDIDDVPITSRITLLTDFPDVKTFSEAESADYEAVGSPELDDLESAVPYIQASRIWFVHLVCCQSVKKLSAKNVIGYLAGKGLTATYTDIFLRASLYASGRAGEFLKDKELFEIIVTDPFVAYHTSYSSTALLCKKCFDDSPEVMSLIIPDTDQKAIEESLERPFDKEANSMISERTIALCALYLKAAKGYPDDWFQGNKALDNALLGLKNMATPYFVAVMRAKASIRDDLDGKNMAELISMIPEGMKK
jgi:hypothetical protein